ncbi:ABC transporter permease [Pontibacillus litoralis JSM 072002]|uniref:ABC transporter permease n=1 Tax=Pontibacillus litoralis JSM 072002 TaxID=1385512 RepID=A0A0A5HWZ0_9BACI|nr:ABC transporter permease [Pontibacillus litoralis JSM 072002]
MFPLWSSGILLAILGVVICFAVGGILIAGDSGRGGGLMAAFIGVVIVGNGIIHFLIGLALTVGKQFTNKNT